MRNVAIVGIGHSKFGRRLDVSLPELAWEAIREAIEDAGLDTKDIEFVSLANIGVWSSEVSPGSVIMEYAGLNPSETIRVETACASGSAAVKTAYMAVASGQADVAMALGIERMNEMTTPEVVEILARIGNYFWEFHNFGPTFVGYYALFATQYMHKYGATEEDLAKVAVKNHYYASYNPKAHFPKKITLEDALNSPYIAWPLKLYDCSPISDGAAAVILASEEVAKKITDSPVWIRAIEGATATSNHSKRENLLSIPSARIAAEKAYRRAKIDKEDPTKYLDLAEVHDCFTIAEIMAYEDLGFAKRGEGYKLIRDEQTYIGGKIPVNLSGGLKAKGHPIGATGVSMIVELTKQLQQRVEPQRQAPIEKGLALAHNVGGTGHYVFVSILSLEKPW
ncbi:MAG: thiolase domain-containing protein [Candidatus Njordarchaeales archaeon]